MKDDARLIAGDFGVTTRSVLDLSSSVRALGVSPPGLRGVSAIFLGKRLSKVQQMSNWEARRLSKAQALYAATDAWAGKAVLDAMVSKCGETSMPIPIDVNS